MSRLDRLSPTAGEENCVRVVIETPRKSRSKFKFEPELGAFRRDKLLPAGMYFPHDFGFVPSTRGEDGDPIDVLVFADEPSFPGCVIDARLIGVLEAQQTEDGTTIRNDRLLAIDSNSRELANVRALSDLPSQLLDEIEDFFVTYNKSEGREFEVLARHGPRRAEKLLATAVRARRGKAKRKRAKRRGR